MKNLVLHHHLGLGDHIICNGLVNYLLVQWKIEKLHLVTKKTNEKSVRHLYSENSKIDLLVFDSSRTDEALFASRVSTLTGFPMLKITAASGLSFDKLFYASVGVPFDARYSFFRQPSRMQSASGDFIFSDILKADNDCLLADKTSAGEFELKVDSEHKIFKVGARTDSIFDWIDVILNAREIHCVDSSFIHLADSFDLIGKQLFYHDVRGADTFNLRNNWIKLNY